MRNKEKQQRGNFWVHVGKLYEKEQKGIHGVEQVSIGIMEHIWERCDVLWKKWYFAAQVPIIKNII